MIIVGLIMAVVMAALIIREANKVYHTGEVGAGPHYG